MFQEIPASKKSLGQRKLIYGVGINDAEYLIEYRLNNKRIPCPYYLAWTHMLQRCYDTKFHNKHPTYKDCTVCTEWRIFSKFKSWMVSQDWQGKQLDKDLLVKDNKEYSPKTCLFVTSQINNIILDVAAKRGKYVVGVCWNKQCSKFVAYSCVNGKKKHLGYFLTEDEASQAYKLFKKELLINTAKQENNLQIKEALLRIASSY